MVDGLMDTALERFELVQKNVEAACVRSGRSPDEVQLVAVSKTHGPDAVEELAGVGQVAFGENRVQEAKQKIPLCSGGLEWHMVGHLQTNKVRDTVQLFSTIHSIDSLRLLEAVDAACGNAGKTMRVLLEINVSGESSKYGLSPADVPALLERSFGLMYVDLVGLMTIPPFTEDAEQARPHFRKLVELRDAWREQSGVALPELSMGMSNDYEIAVEEGATWIRLGTLLFGKRRSVVKAGKEELG